MIELTQFPTQLALGKTLVRSAKVESETWAKLGHDDIVFWTDLLRSYCVTNMGWKKCNLKSV